MLSCSINGKVIEVEKGTSIIEAFKASGDEICHYCYHPGLSIAGVCRLCMVSIEGNPRLQIACNTEVTDGMVVTNHTEEVEEAVQWGLNFHLINHPLDCPICDQAGECELQNQYMKFGRYTPEMMENKVKKHKVVDLGPKIVLDTERCILCSRCVRFTSEVSKTEELGIFNRGDRSEIGTFEGTPLDNNYAHNTIDICPVGALTSRDFRFKQRVWYLKEAKSICPGCSTGCSVKINFNEEGLFRVRPEYHAEVNGHWMCDKGRDIFKWVNRSGRLTTAKWHVGDSIEELSAGEAVQNVGIELSKVAESERSQKVGLVLTGQYTCEEYASILKWYMDSFKGQKVYHWKNGAENWDDFDGLLLRGDENPNTKGLEMALTERGLSNEWSELEKDIASNALEWLVVAGPENVAAFKDLKEKMDLFSKVPKLIWMGTGESEGVQASSGERVFIPTKTFFEKNGSFINHEGRAQSIKCRATVVSEALTLSEVAQLLGGESLPFGHRPATDTTMKTNYLIQERGQI